MDEINFILTKWSGPTALRRELGLRGCCGYGRNKFHPYKMVRAYGTATENVLWEIYIKKYASSL